jgi:hypothetical protein
MCTNNEQQMHAVSAWPAAAYLACCHPAEILLDAAQHPLFQSISSLQVSTPALLPNHCSQLSFLHPVAAAAAAGCCRPMALSRSMCLTALAQQQRQQQQLAVNMLAALQQAVSSLSPQVLRPRQATQGLPQSHHHHQLLLVRHPMLRSAS